MSKTFDINTLPKLTIEMIEFLQDLIGKGDDEAGIVGKYAVTAVRNPGFYPAGVVVPIVAQTGVNGSYWGFFKGIEGTNQGTIPSDGGDTAVWSLGRLGEGFELFPYELEA